jgi:hypothetical protein
MRTKWRRLLAIILFAPVIFLVMVNIHEIGHTLLARALGDEDAVYYLYREFDTDKACFGCNIYNPRKLTAFENTLVTVAGVLSSQLVVLGLLWLWSRRTRHPGHHYLMVTAIIIFASDVPFQVFRGIRADVASQTGLVRVDLADFLYILHRTLALPVDAGKIGLLLVAAAYCLWLFRAVRSRLKRPRSMSAGELDAVDAG